MPDVLQEELLHYNLDDFLGGVNSYFPANKIGDNFLTQAQNALVNENGVLTRRPGLTRLGTFPATVTPTNPVCMLAAGEGVKKKVYCAFGQSTSPNIPINAWDGSTWHEIFVAVTGSETASLCWLRESSGSEFVYQVAPDGVLGEVGRFTLTNVGVLPTGTLKADTNSDPPRKGRYIINHLSRIWIAGLNTDNRDVLYYSAVIPNNETWDRTVNQIPVGTVTGQAITGIAPFRENMIFIGQENSCSLLAVGSHPVFDAELIKVSSDIGLGSFYSIANVGEDLFFMDQHGEIRSLQRTLGDRGSSVRNVPLSLPIKNHTEAIKKSRIYFANAAFFRGFYWLSFQKSDNSFVVFAFSLSLQKWFGPMVFKNSAGNQLNVYAMHAFSGDPGTATLSNRNQHLYLFTDNPAGTASNRFQVFELDYSVTKDHAATAIDLEIITKAHDFGAPHQDKWLRYVEITFKKVTGATGNFDLQCRRDFGTWITIAETVDYTTGNEIQTLKIPIGNLVGRGRLFQFRIKSSDLNTQLEIVRIVIAMLMYEPTSK